MLERLRWISFALAFFAGVILYAVAILLVAAIVGAGFLLTYLALVSLFLT
jgi:hypothetical protein